MPPSGARSQAPDTVRADCMGVLLGRQRGAFFLVLQERLSNVPFAGRLPQTLCPQAGGLAPFSVPSTLFSFVSWIRAVTPPAQALHSYSPRCGACAQMAGRYRWVTEFSDSCNLASNFFLFF